MGKWGDAGNREVREPPPFRIFGELRMELSIRAFITGGGAGGVKYDESVHGDNMHECMIFNVYPVYEMNWGGEFNRTYETNSYEWVKIVTQSMLDTLGILDPGNDKPAWGKIFDRFDGSHIALEEVQSRTTYKDKKDLDENGKPTIKKKRAAQIMAVFESEEACGKACSTHRGLSDAQRSAPASAPARAGMLNVFKAMIKASGVDAAKEQYVVMPQLQDAFSLDDEDVQAILAAG